MSEDEIINGIDNIDVNQKSKNNGLMILLLVLLVLAITWFLVRPGVFTIQPIGALPKGITFIYHSRNPEIPFFSSPDGMCLDIQGGVSLMCRGAMLSASEPLVDRIIIRLSYSHWAYLRSTDGMEFGR